MRHMQVFYEKNYAGVLHRQPWHISARNLSSIVVICLTSLLLYNSKYVIWYRPFYRFSRFGSSVRIISLILSSLIIINWWTGSLGPPPYQSYNRDTKRCRCSRQPLYLTARIGFPHSSSWQISCSSAQTSSPVKSISQSTESTLCEDSAVTKKAEIYLRSINPMMEKINPTIPIPIESSSIPDEQREITIAKSNIAIPNPIFFMVNPPLQILKGKSLY